MGEDIAIKGLNEAILAKAKYQEKEILEATKNKVDEINQATKLEVEKIISNANKEAEVIKSEVNSRNSALDNVDERLAKLEKKHSYINDALNAARKSLEEESIDEKIKRYFDLLPNNLSGAYTITPAEGESEIIRELIKNIDSEAIFEISTEEGSFCGGYILTGKEFIYDRSYRTIFREQSDNLTRLAATMLFEEID